MLKDKTLKLRKREKIKENGYENGLKLNIENPEQEREKRREKEKRNIEAKIKYGSCNVGSFSLGKKEVI